MSEKVGQKILVTGMKGMVGGRFAELNPDLNLVTASRPDFDITKIQTVKETVEMHKPDWVVNFVGYVNVNEAENQSGDEKGEVWKTNVTGVSNLVESFNPRRIIHISSDMVFPGNSENPGPYKEGDVLPESGAGLTWYGWSKNRGEKIARTEGSSVIRLIYPVLAHAPKLDYIRSVLSRYSQGKMYPLFNDQQVSISYVDEMAKVIRKIIETESSGVFHVSTDLTTPYELIEYTLKRLGKNTTELREGSLVEFLKTQANPNRYPILGGLDVAITQEKLGVRFSNWKEVVDHLISQGMKVPE